MLVPDMLVPKSKLLGLVMEVLLRIASLAVGCEYLCLKIQLCQNIRVKAVCHISDGVTYWSVVRGILVLGCKSMLWYQAFVKYILPVPGDRPFVRP